jgi:Coenzyme PQQ synthesis protein D (PqqD)
VAGQDRQKLMVERSAMIIRNPRVEYRKLEEGGAVLLNLDTAAYHGLNQTGSAIWESVGDGKSIDTLVPEVALFFEDAPPSLDQEITSFIEDLVERDLLRIDHGRPAEPNALDTADRGTE